MAPAIPVAVFRGRPLKRLGLLGVALLAGLPLAARASATLRIDDDRFITVGLGLRVVASTQVPGAPAQDLARPEFALDSALLGLTGQLRPEVKLQLNVARQPTGELRFLDAIGMFEPRPFLKIWAGRMLPPVDRASLIGPLFASTWDVPFVGISGTQAGGREDGVVLWGEPLLERVRVQLGAFRGVRGPTNPLGRLLYTGRVTLNLLQPEPGYYHLGTTYGARDVLSFGVGGRYQRSATGAGDLTGDLATFAIDGLLEKKLEWGVVNVEAGFYLHRNGGVVDPVYANANGAYALAGYLVPVAIGPGRVQTVLRYQRLSPPLGTSLVPRTREDVNLNYIIQGHPLRLGLVLLHEAAPAGVIYGAKLGAQLIL